MARLRTYSLVLALGCGHTGDSLGHAVHVSRQALHAVSIAADEAADLWAEGVDARISHCRAKDLPTPQARAECLGPWGKGEEFSGELKELRDAYDVAATALAELEAAAASVQRRIEQGQQK